MSTAVTSVPAVRMTVDELAHSTGIPVRTIREYQTMRLLPPPVKNGRVGLYDERHRDRLALIGRLQQRGYSLAGIRDLLTSFEAGANLPALLGIDFGPAVLDETPLRLTRDQLTARLPGLTTTSLRRACAVGLVTRDASQHYLIRSPALLALVADGVAVGVRLTSMLDLVDVVRNHLDELAGAIADRIVDEVWERYAATERAADIDRFLRRGRVLLLQGVASMLADRLGDAIARRAPDATHGDALRAAIERVRVGAIVDGEGNLEHRRPQ